MNYILWNVRGMGSGGKRRIIKELSIAHNPDILHMVETKLDNLSPTAIRQISSRKIKEWIIKEIHGASRGIIICFHTENYSLVVIGGIVYTYMEIKSKTR